MKKLLFLYVIFVGYKLYDLFIPPMNVTKINEDYKYKFSNKDPLDFHDDFDSVNYDNGITKYTFKENHICRN